MKRVEAKTGGSYLASNISAKDSSPFEQMKAAIRNNLKGLKKDEDKDGIDIPSGLGGISSSSSVNNPSIIGGASTGMMSSRRVRYWMLKIM